MKKLNIKRVLMHIGAHLDEMVGYMIARRAPEVFVGIVEATVDFVTSTALSGDEECDKEGILAIGTAFTRFDEHLSGGIKERKDGECAATLVAKYANPDENSAEMKLAREVYRFDNDAIASPTHMSEIIKVAHRRLTDGDHKILKWVTIGIEAVLAQLRIGTQARPGEKSLGDFFDEYVTKRAGTADPVDERVARQIEEWITSAASGHGGITDITHVVACLQRENMKVDDVAEWLMFVFDHMVADQMNYPTAIEELKNAETFEFTNDYGGRSQKLKAIIVQSDNPMCGRASRSKEIRAAILVQISSNGHVFIPTDKHKIACPRNLVRMIRYTESERRKDGVAKSTSWYELGNDGMCNGIGEWYLHKGTLMNGSDTHPDVPITALSKGTFRNLISLAFRKDGIREWTRYRKINTRRSNPEREITADSKIISLKDTPAAEKLERALDEPGNAAKNAEESKPASTAG